MPRSGVTCQAVKTAIPILATQIARSPDFIEIQGSGFGNWFSTFFCRFFLLLFDKTTLLVALIKGDYAVCSTQSNVRVTAFSHCLYMVSRLPWSIWGSHCLSMPQFSRRSSTLSQKPQANPAA